MKSTDLLDLKIFEWQKELNACVPTTFVEKMQSGDFFSVEENKEGLKVTYSNKRIASFAIKQLLDAIHAKDSSLFDSHQAKTEWRIAYPTIDCLEEKFLEKLVVLGFNGVIVDENALNFIPLIKKFGLKVLLKPHKKEDLVPFQKDYKERIHKFLSSYPEFDILYWESPYFFKNCKKELLDFAKLRIELHLEELLHLETFFPLIYALPEEASHRFQWKASYFSELEKHLGPKSYLSFSSFEGKPSSYHLASSPFWRLNLEKSLPVMDIYSGKEMLLMQDQCNLFSQNKIPGAIIKINQPPSEKSFGEANLLMAMKALFFGKNPEDTLHYWLKLHHPKLFENGNWHQAFSNIIPHLALIESHFLESHLSCPPEELKMHGEELGLILKRLDKNLEKERKKALLDPEYKKLVQEIEETISYIRKKLEKTLTKFQITVPYLI